MSSIQVLPCVSPIPVGRMVVLNSSFQAIQYNPAQHTVSQVVGTSYPKINYNSNNVDGWVFLEKDYWKWKETLQYDQDVDGNLIVNPDYDPNFNFATDSAYVAVCCNGLAPFDKTNPASPTTWKKVRNGTAYDLYIVN